jgi:hypothetical protein
VLRCGRSAPRRARRPLHSPRTAAPCRSRTGTRRSAAQKLVEKQVGGLCPRVGDAQVSRRRGLATGSSSRRPRTSRPSRGEDRCQDEGDVDVPVTIVTTITSSTAVRRFATMTWRWRWKRSGDPADDAEDQGRQVVERHSQRHKERSGSARQPATDRASVCHRPGC